MTQPTSATGSEVSKTPEPKLIVINAIDAIKAAISKLEDSIYIDALRMNKGWHPFQVPEIVNLKKAIKILEDNESQFTFCCKDIKNPDCNCMKYIKESGILTHG